jgi:putative DNA-binding protein
MTTIAPKLLETQRAMRAAVLERADTDLRPYIVADGLDASERLDVYRNTSASVLTAALGLSYPAVKRLVGNEFFEGAAGIFIAGEPPQSACLDDYGAGFPAFLEQFPPASSLSYLPDVARLEWAVSSALHAEEVLSLDAEWIARLPSLDIARVSLVAHPSLTLIESRYPVDAIWRSVLDRDDAAMRAIDLGAGPVWLLVERAAARINVQRMGEAAWRFTAALRGGQPLHASLERDCEPDPAILLADHISKGRFVDVRLG